MRSWIATALFLVILIPSVLFAQEKGQNVGRMETKRRAYIGAIVQAEVLAYCLCTECCGNDAAAADGKTATGKDGKRFLDGVIAAPSLLPYGTRLFIPGIGEKVVDDTGSRAKKEALEGKYRIAIRFKDHKAMLDFRKRNHLHKEITVGRKMAILIIEQTREKK